MKKQVTDKKIHAKKNKVKRVTVRFTEAAAAAIVKTSAKAGLAPSVFLRNCALGLQVPSKTDQQAAAELRRIGSMLKHLYPKDSNWTTSEKRQYWSAMHTLLGVAKNLDGKGFKGDQDRSDVG
ncbi:hypothetical protein ICN10_01555 [Polynucleobacter sp. 86C-FISCH]|uniref:plasmid mobilization protein n=1 Tax=Polynucleobacter sp. 86C-FISCH TaxID=2689101 RepID=UPI001C0CF971|nr:hypothetical protein [Polynucleobacter sp. 86C-FISCH]MBU3595082.1 hypothetical protein [Polynucleobacter sp. 86C-FISCH]